MKTILCIFWSLFFIGCAAMPKCPQCPSEELILKVDCPGSPRPLILPFEQGELDPDHKSHGQYWIYKHELPKAYQDIVPIDPSTESREEWKERIEAQGRPTAGM